MPSRMFRRENAQQAFIYYSRYASAMCALLVTREGTIFLCFASCPKSIISSYTLYYECHPCTPGDQGSIFLSFTSCPKSIISLLHSLL